MPILQPKAENWFSAYSLTCSYECLLMAISVSHNYGLLPSLRGSRRMLYTHIGTNCSAFSSVPFFVLILRVVIESEFMISNWKIFHLLKTTIKPSRTVVRWINVEYQNKCEELSSIWVSTNNLVLPT